MLNRWTIAFVAGAFAFAGLPASALDLPDYGSKNFNPPSDTPTHFANETAPVSARTADTTANDWSDVDAIAPAQSATAASERRGTHAGRHGRHASAQRHGRSAKHGTHSARTGSRNPAWAGGTRGASKSAAIGSTKTNAAKHGKAGARQARAAVTYPAVTRGGTLLSEA
jgi:hypothetical protein